MRIGTFLFLMVAVLVAFGFILSDWIRLRHELDILQETNRKLTSELAAADLVHIKDLKLLGEATGNLRACEQEVAGLESAALQSIPKQVVPPEEGNWASKAMTLLLGQIRTALWEPPKTTFANALAILGILTLQGSAALAIAKRLARRSGIQAHKQKSEETANSLTVLVTKGERDLLIRYRRAQSHGIRRDAIHDDRIGPECRK